MSVLGFDTETKGLDWFRPEQGAFLLSWASEAQPADAETPECGLHDFTYAVHRADTLVAHNLPFDVHQVREATGIDLLRSGKRLVDTAILSRIVLPERLNAGAGYKLKDLATTYLDPAAKEAEEAIEALAKSIKVTLKSDGGYYEVWRAYPHEMEHYARKDAEYTRDLLPILEAKLTPRLKQCWDLEQAVQPVLIGAEQRGVRVDPVVVDQLRREYEPLAERYGLEVHGVLGEDLNLNSPDQLRAALLEHGVPLHRLTDHPTSPQLSTAAFVLQEFEDQFPVLKALSAWRAADKMLGTYIGPMTGREIVHTSFWQVGARTGRMSCSRPNMQNLPSRDEPGDTKLREVFIPRDGMAFVVCDYESIELKLLAHYLNDQAFQQSIEDGFPVFQWLASELWGGNPEDYAKGTPGESRRSQAKNVVYAITYGAGYNRVKDMLNVPYEEAKRIVQIVKRKLPGYKALANTWPPLGRVPSKIKAEGFVTTLMGRKQVVPQAKAYVGLNALIQGSAADIFKQGVVNAALATQDCGAEPVLFVHDEVVMECPIEWADEVLRLTNQAMCDAWQLFPRLEVSGAVCLHNYSQGK